ncbi:MAG TPA: HEAT repeat domain-containing protein, partial [Gemmata sp.]|nr:HEAT repeat domain-containing protein [Gemmata sp.]
MDVGWLVRLDQTLSSYSVLAGLMLTALAVGILYQSGILGWALDLFGRFTRSAIHGGFLLWERWLSWADWWVYLLLTIALLIAGALAAGFRPEVTLLCAGMTLFMGVVACLAYMFIDIERYEVERGYKAVHSPTKGQELAPNVARYGHRVGVPLLAVATAGAISGFALLNQSLYETIGRGWYRVDDESRPGFAEFLTYALINLLRVIDVLDLADSSRLIHTTFVRKAAWPAATLLAAFRSFFTLIILQQVFASVRQGRLLAETIADFWSPHQPIHERARNALPQFGGAVIDPLLISLREMTALTKEQRDQLPQVLAALGPSTIPTLVRYLHDPHEHIRAVAASALGHLHGRETTAELASLVGDSSGLVRLSAVDALGLIALAGPRAERSRRLRMPLYHKGRGSFLRRRSVPSQDYTTVAVAALRQALTDDLAAVRCQAAVSLGRAGTAAVGEAMVLAKLLGDPDETVRCRAAEALGRVGGAADFLLTALLDPAAPVRVAAAHGLKSLGRDASVAVPKLLELLQDRDEALRPPALADVASPAARLDAALRGPRSPGWLRAPERAHRGQASATASADSATSSRSSAVESSVSQLSPMPTTRSASSRFSSIMRSILSSSVPTQT